MQIAAFLTAQGKLENIHFRILKNMTASLI